MFQAAPVSQTTTVPSEFFYQAMPHPWMPSNSIILGNEMKIDSRPIDCTRLLSMIQAGSNNEYQEIGDPWLTASINAWYNNYIPNYITY